MPKFYDPTKSDPSVILINWIDSILNGINYFKMRKT